ncbi:MAG: VanW family protein, partial [Oscillospiraceae bacterium]
MESQPKPTTRKSKKVPLIICGVIAAAIVIPAVCFGTYVNSYDKVYPNVYVGETNIGGQTAENAANTLNNIYTADKLQDKKIKLSCKEANSEIAIKNLSIHFDNTKTTSDAFSYGRSGNIFMRMYDYLMFSFGRHEVSPSMKYDEQALTGAINDIAKPYEVEPIGYTHKIDTNKLTLYKSVDGIKVNRELVTNQIESEILSFTFNPITLEPVVTSPPKLDFDEFYAYVTSDAKNASYEKVDGHVVVKPGKLKCEIDKESVNSAIIELEGGTESFEMVAKTTPPAVTSEMLTADLYSETLGSYNSDFGGSSAPRANNVRLASKKMNGTELMPGEVFSYNNIVGERSRANGFQAAPVFVGNKVESGLGGGVCQPSSTLYSAVLYANLEIVERNQHSLSVSYMPGGMDATVSYGSLDFRFKNNTPYPVKV